MSACDSILRQSDRSAQSDQTPVIRSAVAALLACVPVFAAEPARQVRDDAGDRIAISAAPCRIVSLAPGTTAMLFAAGAGHCLVGTIAHSTEPEEAARLPIIGD